MLANLIYIHLRPPHSTECQSAQKCAPGCPYRQFHAWLDEPVTTWDVRADERRKQRIEALKRGEIPT